jgi:hypothetical protein
MADPRSATAPESASPAVTSTAAAAGGKWLQFGGDGGGDEVDVAPRGSFVHTVRVGAHGEQEVVVVGGFGGSANCDDAVVLTGAANGWVVPPFKTDCSRQFACFTFALVVVLARDPAGW